MNTSPKTFLTMLILGDVKVILIFKKCLGLPWWSIG